LLVLKTGVLIMQNEVFIMKNHMVIGIGCFARPDKLSRIFLKIVRNYALGSIEGIDLVDGNDFGETESNRWIEALIAGKNVESDSPDSASADVPENRKITGFFLALKDQRLKLSIFAKKGNCQQVRHSAVLDALTNMRRSRLN
jgi:hypothetical protein